MAARSAASATVGIPLGNLRKMSIQEVTEASEVIVCFTRDGTASARSPRRLQDCARTLDQIRVCRHLGQGSGLSGGNGGADGRTSSQHESMRTGKQSHQAAAESEEFVQDRLQQAVINLPDPCQFLRSPTNVRYLTSFTMQTRRRSRGQTAAPRAHHTSRGEQWHLKRKQFGL
jgi:hypothetical protein